MLVPLGLSLLAASQFLNALRNVAEQDFLFAAYYLLTGAMLVPAAIASRAYAGPSANSVAFVTLAAAAAVHDFRVLSYPLSRLPPSVLAPLLAGAAGFVVLAVGAWGASRLPAAAWSRAVLALGYGLILVHSLAFLLTASMTAVGTLGFVLMAAGAALALVGVVRARATRAGLATGA